MTENRYDNDRVREVIGRAIEIESRETDSVSESELRRIAQEVGVSAAAIEAAIAGLRGEVRANPPQLASAVRRWGFLAVVVALGATTAGVSPATAQELLLPFGILTILSGFAALAPKYIHRRRESTILGIDGVRYLTASGERRLPWSSVVQLKTDIPGTVHLAAPSDSVMLVLSDFGDPDTVLATIRLRLAEACHEQR